MFQKGGVFIDLNIIRIIRVLRIINVNDRSEVILKGKWVSYNHSPVRKRIY